MGTERISGIMLEPIFLSSFTSRAFDLQSFFHYFGRGHIFTIFPFRSNPSIQRSDGYPKLNEYGVILTAII